MLLDEYMDKYRPLVEKVWRDLSAVPGDRFRITFCGQFKSGKSSLINELIGEKLLPVKSTTATAVITRLMYAPKRAAYAVTAGESCPISFDDIPQYILAGQKTYDGVEMPDADEVIITLPNPILQGVELIDTPGLDDDDTLTAITFNQIRHTDLAIIVYDALQLLSQNEKQTLVQIQELLCGNIVFAVNKIDLVGRDPADVREHADYFLSAFGNTHVGQGYIFYTTAKEQQADIDSLDQWLQALPMRQEGICQLSRLSILRHDLDEVLADIQQDINDIQPNRDQLYTKSQESIKKQNQEWIDRKNEIRKNAAKCKNNILNSLNTECVRESGAKFERIKNQSGWRSHFSNRSKEAAKQLISQYCQKYQRQLVNECEIDFIEVPALQLLGEEIDHICFPSAKISSSGWGATIICAIIGTVITPIVGTLIGFVIGRIIDLKRAESKVLDNLVPLAVGVFERKVIPAVRTRIDNFFIELNEEIEWYEDGLVFVSGHENELEQYDDCLYYLQTQQREMAKMHGGVQYHIHSLASVSESVEKIS